MRTLLFLGLAALVSAGCRSSSPSVATEASAALAGERLTQLVEGHFEETLVLNPVRATMIGDNRYNDRFTNSLSDEHRARRRALFERSLEAARKLDTAALSPEQQLTHAGLRQGSPPLQDDEGLRGLPGPRRRLPRVEWGAGLGAMAGHPAGAGHRAARQGVDA